MLRDTIFAPLAEAARAGPRLVRQAAGDTPVLFRTERQNGSLYLEFLPGVDPARPRLDVAGAFIIKRSASDGAFIQAKVFLQNDSGCFLRLTPAADRTSMEIVLFGEPYQRGVLIAASFESLLTAPLERIERLSGGVVDWDLLIPAPRTAADAAVEKVVAAVRRWLPRFRYVEDGARDADGRWVFIRDGSPQGAAPGVNCSGFAKWFVDGFYAPLAGRSTEVASLRSRGTGLRGNRWSDRYEEERDPWFGLDWSRNLASMLARARGETDGDPRRFDERTVPGFPYVENVGHPVATLATVLWLLEREAPGGVYLGSVNRQVAGDPQLRQHHHLVVLAPWVDASRTFRVAVFESGTESSLDSLRGRFGPDYIHLVRIDAQGPFVPPPVE